MKTYSHKAGGEALVSVVCSLCGDSRTRKYWDCGDFSYVRCRGCGVVYQNPQPVREGILLRYDQDYFSYEIENEGAFFNLMNLALEDGGFEAWAQGVPQPRRFLDIGCATGILLENMRARGWEPTGVEVCRPSAQYGIEHRNLDIKMKPLEEVGFPGDHFEAVHLSHLIEHLNEPGPFLDELVRVTKPGGRLFITTPNTAGFQARFFQAAWRSAIPDHLYLFSKKTLVQVLKARGLKILQVKTWGGLAVGAGPRWLKGILDPWSKAWGFGDVVLVVAEKVS